MRNLTIKMRLIIFSFIVSAMMAMVGGIGWWGVKSLSDSIDTIYLGSVDSIYGLEIILTTYKNDIIFAVEKVHNKNSEQEKTIQNIVLAREKIENHWKEYLKTRLSPEQRGMIEQINIKMNMVNSFLDKLLDTIKLHDESQLIESIINTMYSTLDPVLLIFEKLIQSHIDETTHHYQVAKDFSGVVITLTIICIIFGVISTALLCFFIGRNILNQINQALDVIDRLASGDLSVRIDIQSNDEIGKMLKAMQNMIDSNATIIAVLANVAEGNLMSVVTPRSNQDVLSFGLNSMIEKMRNMIREIRQEIMALTHSTQEIITSVSNVSVGTAETAAAVTETTSTVEELTQTAHVAADKAKDVLDSADKALEIVKKGENSLNSTIEDMNQIQEKMKVISESIIKLSEHSLAIGEIIDSVNDLAEQSNLLAVNAAIEAAKAGDQGKSFGVVAQEIRLLAEQSKTATIQVRSILNDIQNSTSAAILATEQGTKAVKKGVDQSSQTNAAIHSLSSSTAQVVQSANQIALSCQQQLVGVDQVKIAMTNIQEASNQHVDLMKQIEGAVISLNTVGESLKDLINVYQMQENQNRKIKETNKKKIQQRKNIFSVVGR